MIAKILNAGSGGQGVLTLGNILANAGMLQDFYVTYLPAYGAAVRGGTANCTVNIADIEIASPVASAPDVVMAMNQPSINTFINRVVPGGQILYNSSLIDSVPDRGDIDLYPFPASDLAAELGNTRSANMIMLGALVKLLDIVTIDKINESIESLMSSKKKLVEVSIKAVSMGFDKFQFKKAE